MRVDVAVIGLGAMGSGALWRLAARGADVVGLEQFEPGHDQGSSHGDTRMIRTAYYESPDYVPLVQAAFPLWRQIEQESGAALLTMTGALMIGREEWELVPGALESARRHGLAHELLDARQLAARFPQFRLAPDEMAVHEEQAGVLRPEAAIQAMIDRARELGATVLPRTVVTRIEPGAGTIRVTTADERFDARHVVVTAGSWLPSLLPEWRLPLAIERQFFAWWPVPDGERYGPRAFPPFMHEIAAGRFRYGIPSMDGVVAKLGIHHEGALTTPQTIDRTVRDSDLEPMRTYLRATLPEVAPVPSRTQVCMYTNTPDHHFMIGSPPGMPSVTVISACSGHGFKYAPVLGDAAADLALDGRTAYPIQRFSPDRFAAGAIQA